jgi:hypothetical protein
MPAAPAKPTPPPAKPTPPPTKPLTDPASLKPAGAVEVRSPGQVDSSAAESPEDKLRIEQQLNATQKAAPATAKPKDSLKVKPADTDEDDEIDEIFIDLRGNLSHKKPENNE